MREWQAGRVDGGYAAPTPPDGGVERLAVQTLDEMRDRCLLTDEQHAEIGAWVSQARTPEAILAMPEGLWRTLELASVLMDVDADLRRPPELSFG
ncbi:hypothetical protein ACS5PN_13390 [Roseateles sp. NT4]|uniref:hypothetical protein n=1 Tax=Roseateles sp. NT4 TaxID=3453715 RepID=UPI003EEEC381